jgi:Curli production assembly/transport component CsgG
MCYYSIIKYYSYNVFHIYKGVIVKRFIFLLLMILTFIFSINAQESSSPTIAVMEVAATNTSIVKSQVIYEYIVDVVNRSERYTIVERAALQAALKEMEISASGMVDDTTAAEIGKLAGAELILISNLIVDDGITYLSARIVSVETGQVNDTAMLQMQEDEYIASLANRTISQLLGQPEGKPGSAVDETNKDKTEVVEKTKEEAKIETGSIDNSVSSKLSLTVGAAAIIPVLDDAEIFNIGYGLIADLNYRILSFGKNSLSVGIGTGLHIDKASAEKGVIYPYNMLSIPLLINTKYILNINKLYFSAKIAAGGTLNMFIYTETAPTEKTTVLVLKPAIFPGISIGYNINRKIGLALFCDWSMTFYNTYPYTALNAGLAVDLNL